MTDFSMVILAVALIVLSIGLIDFFGKI